MTIAESDQKAKTQPKLPELTLEEVEAKIMRGYEQAKRGEVRELSAEEFKREMRAKHADLIKENS